ncbi:uncharacterized protein PV09_04284 [Verruconis gallopava]|uniref:Uncharacterized protein n=1 Tax=Verruconis gallopava TaxID=253628 RepID=A0A0D2ADL0_9PEZI|nr:uncharacterized protein PV09_04284 [Verruconis gallopava]KIW04530.1 hypothetical protein PV09_04284 [Verruconis gallopava]
MVITAVFRCPSTIANVSDESPKICRPYLHFRDQAMPYVQPYYDIYLKTYIDRAQPHVDSLNRNVVAPAAIFAKEKYTVYGAPCVAQLKDYAEGTWSSTLKPRLEVRRKWARAQYDQTLGPHVDQVYSIVKPYTREVFAEVAHMYDTTIIPLYYRAVPVLHQAFKHGHHISTEIIFPNVRYAQQVSFEFLRRKLWPMLVLLYGENVEPQLTKIMERVGRYKDARNMQNVVTGELNSEPTSMSSVTGKDVSITPSASASPERQTAIPTSSSNPVVEDDTREKIQSDLSGWKRKFALAAERGTTDLRNRVEEITSRQIENQAQGVANGLVIKLDETAKTVIDDVKAKIIELIQDLPEDADQDAEDALYEKVVQTVRSAGTAIKEKAQAIREWENKYDADTTSLVTAALESTLKIVDSIRDLGLQQIGMRWANMEGVTYEDWATYHDLKSEFDSWRHGIEDAALKHKGLEAARAEGERVREVAIRSAQNAVAELVRLRDASKWKIAARDSTDDFSSKVVPPRAKVVDASHGDSKNVAQSQPSDGTAEGLSAAVGAATSSIADLFKDGLEVVDALTEEAMSSVGSAYESVKLASTSSMDDLASSASFSAANAPRSVLSAAKDKSEQARSVVGTPAPENSQASISANLQHSEASPSTQSVISKSSPDKDEAFNAFPSISPQAPSIASDSISSNEPANELTTASSKVFGIPGALAADVGQKQIVLDHPFDADDTLSEYLAIAGDKGSELTDVVKEALKGFTAEPTQGIVEGITSVAGEQIARALTAASEALYGTPTGELEGIEDKLTKRYHEAVTAASYAIYGTPQPVLASIASQASAKFDEAVNLAKQQYSKASIEVAGTPKPAYEEAISSIESSYSESLSLASEKLESILGYTASITHLWASPTQGVYASVSSVASERLQQGLSKASSQYEKAKSAAGLQDPPAHQQYLAEAQKQYYQGIGFAHDQYSRFLEAASTAVYGTPTPAYQTLLELAQAQYTGAVSAAKSVYDELVQSINEVVDDKERSPAQSILASAASQYEFAKSQAADILAAASASASSAVFGTSAGNVEYLASAANEQLFGSTTPWLDAAASRASANWDSLISSASSAIYGTPAPWHESAYSQAGEYAAQATDAAASQYAALAGLFNELLVGKEPDFTESMMARLSSAYYTGMPNYASSASSLASELYASASSAASSVFTPPPTLEVILSRASEQINSVVDAASTQIYGTEPNLYEKASSAAADAASKVSAAVYGTPASFLERAQAGLADIGENAQKAISEAIYGTSTGSFEAASSLASSVYSSVSSVAAENAATVAEKFAQGYSAAGSKVSEAVYYSEKSALESAHARILAELSSAQARLEDLAAQATGSMKDNVNAMKSRMGEAAGSVSSAVANVKDEL